MIFDCQARLNLTVCCSF